MTTIWLTLMIAAAQEPPPPAVKPGSDEDEVRRIVRQVKEQAEQTTQADRAAAMDLLEKAERARRDGKKDQARTLGRQAQSKFPESLVISHWLAQLEAEGNDGGREQRVNQRLALTSLNEANALVERLLAEGQGTEARTWLDTVFTAANRFPPSDDLAFILGRTRQLQQRLATLSTADPIEPPPPPPAPAKELLARKMDVNWVQLPAFDALQEIANATGVTFTVDPDVARMRILENQPLSVQVGEFPAERLLRVITETTLTEALLLDQGQVVITTKAKALALSVQQRQPTGPLRASPPSATAPARVRVEKSRAEATPTYLRSPAEFLKHLDELLELPAVPPPPRQRELPP
ncbi:MAG TPA: hypothetical protein PKC45_13325 [Gemmatales bacterium]|nr:hypothetical protein [Gemmatales bacterium]